MRDDRMNLPPDGCISVDDACVRLGREIWYLRRLIDRGKIQRVIRREGLTKRAYIEVASLEAYIASQQGGQP